MTPLEPGGTVINHLHVAEMGYGDGPLPSEIVPLIAPTAGGAHSQALLGTCVHVTAEMRSGGGVVATGTMPRIAQLAMKPVCADISSSVLNSTCKNLYSVVPVE